MALQDMVIEQCLRIQKLAFIFPTKMPKAPNKWMPPTETAVVLVFYFKFKCLFPPLIWGI